MADVYDVIVPRGPEYWTENQPVFVSGLHTQEKAEDKSETLVCTPVMWVLFAAVNMLLTLEDCLYACLSPTMIKCCCHVSNRSIHHREEDQDFTVDVVTEG
jgi:hypothetical protein